MILWSLVFAGILVGKGFFVKNKKTLAIYVGIGMLGLGILALEIFAELPPLLEYLTGQS